MDNTEKQLLDGLKVCSLENYSIVVNELLVTLGYDKDLKKTSFSEDGLCYVVTRGDNDCRYLVVAEQYSMLIVDENEIKHFVETMRFMNLTNGIFITTSQFSIEAQSYKVDGVNIILINGDVITRYLTKESKELFCQNIPKEVKQEIEDDEIKSQRNRKKLIRVTFPDGNVFCDKSPVYTFMQTIKHIGIEKVVALNMEICHVPLISKEVYPKYKDWTKELGDGWFVMLQSDTEQKFRLLISINTQLGLNLRLEYDNDLATLSSDIKNKGSKKERACLLATFADGTLIGKERTVETYIAIIEHIGIEKVSKANIVVTGKPLLSSSREYKNQQKLDNGQWLLVPNTIKDKYKTLRVIAAMTHVKLELTIV